ncbi:NAD(P)H-binding protein [Spirillospora sp. NBC_00431]
MFLVTGATGHVGREVVNLLAKAGERVTAVTRSPASADLPDGVRVVAGDPSSPATVASAFAGVEAILLAPRAVGAATADLLALATEHGVRRAVLLSAITVEYGGGYRRFAEAFEAAEEAVKASGLRWTFLRCADFAANTLAWAPQVRSAGLVRGAYGDAATAAVHEHDIADIAARALRDSTHDGRSYAITGPEPLTQREKARLIGAATGRDVPFVEIPPEQARRDMLAQGLPQDVPDRMLGYLATCRDQPGPATGTVEEILGRPALGFGRWATEHAAVFSAP